MWNWYTDQGRCLAKRELLQKKVISMQGMLSAERQRVYRFLERAYIVATCISRSNPR